MDSVVEEAPSSSKGSGGEGEAGVLQYPGSLFHVFMQAFMHAWHVRCLHAYVRMIEDERPC